MKKILIPALLAVLPSLGLMAADQLTVKAVNKLPIARYSQTIELSAKDLAPLGADLTKIHIMGAAGVKAPMMEMLCQAVDTDFDAFHKPDVVIFQSDFAPGETKTFTVSVGKKIEYQKEDFNAYGRFVRERFDDFAWENNLIAHRTYGKALETWQGEPLTSSAIDIWSKRTPRMVIDEWYMVDNYHSDTGEGCDDYSAGATRGDGGNGLWATDKLWVSKNFTDSRVLANGPIRVMFELDYPPFDVNGRQVLETMRVSLDAGSQMDHYQVTFKPAGSGESLTAAVGLKKVRGDQADFNATRGALAIWEPMEKNLGMQGIAAIVDPKSFVKQAEDKSNNLLLLNAGPSNSINYWAGFAWDKAGKITAPDDWKKYVDEFAQGVQSPIEVSVSAGQ
jgi:pectinesterase